MWPFEGHLYYKNSLELSCQLCRLLILQLMAFQRCGKQALPSVRFQPLTPVHISGCESHTRLHELLGDHDHGHNNSSGITCIMW